MIKLKTKKTDLRYDIKETIKWGGEDVSFAEGVVQIFKAIIKEPELPELAHYLQRDEKSKMLIHGYDKQLIKQFWRMPMMHVTVRGDVPILTIGQDLQADYCYPTVMQILINIINLNIDNASVRKPLVDALVNAENFKQYHRNIKRRTF